MSAVPYVLEFGMGVDLHGEDCTKAACRAVFDAVRHSSLPLLNEIRERLLALHKALFDVQRLWYEKDNGRFEAGEMLQLAAYHPAFAWLRPVSLLIVEIDEKLLDKENLLTLDDVTKVLDDTRGLVLGEAGGDEFQMNYARGLANPDILIARSRLAQLLSSSRE